jgi:hypothetical protein
VDPSTVRTPGSRVDGDNPSLSGSYQSETTKPLRGRQEYLWSRIDRGDPDLAAERVRDVSNLTITLELDVDDSRISWPRDHVGIVAEELTVSGEDYFDGLEWIDAMQLSWYGRGGYKISETAFGQNETPT